MDPVGLNAGANVYAYLNSNPVIQVDPLGLASFEGGVVGSIELKYNICTGDLSVGGWVWAGFGWGFDWWGEHHWIGVYGYWEGEFYHTNIGALVKCGKCKDCCTAEDAESLGGGVALFREGLSKKLGNVTGGGLVAVHSLCHWTIEGIILVNLIDKLGPVAALVKKVAEFLGAEAQLGIQFNFSIHLCIGKNGGIVTDSATIGGGAYIEFGWVPKHEPGRPPPGIERHAGG